MEEPSAIRIQEKSRHAFIKMTYPRDISWHPQERRSCCILKTIQQLKLSEIRAAFGLFAHFKSLIIQFSLWKSEQLMNPIEEIVHLRMQQHYIFQIKLKYHSHNKRAVRRRSWPNQTISCCAQFSIRCQPGQPSVETTSQEGAVSRCYHGVRPKRNVVQSRRYRRQGELLDDGY